MLNNPRGQTIKRRLFHILAAVSLLLFLAFTFLWIGSYRTGFFWPRNLSTPAAGDTRTIFGGSNGDFFWSRYFYVAPPVLILNDHLLETLHYYWRVMGIQYTFYHATKGGGTLLFTFWDLQIPFWILCLLFAPAPLLWFFRFFPRRRIFAAGCCPHCGYDLRAHKPLEKCPECGTIKSHTAEASQ